MRIELCLCCLCLALSNCSSVGLLRLVPSTIANQVAGFQSLLFSSFLLISGTIMILLPVSVYAPLLHQNLLSPSGMQSTF